MPNPEPRDLRAKMQDPLGVKDMAKQGLIIAEKALLLQQAQLDVSRAILAELKARPNVPGVVSTVTP
ncbi:MAG: hypothetical protein L3K18_09590 [Thermoplasmata archaeon]|nr:hypothetical protein [Thermoplasmata archaeon]